MLNKLNDKRCTHAHHPLVQLHASPYLGHTTAHRRSTSRATSSRWTTYDTLHEIFLQHITLPHAPLRGSYCTRSTFPHSERHNTRVQHPYKTDIACNTSRAFTHNPSANTLSSSAYLISITMAHNGTEQYSALSDPTIEAPIGHLVWDLPIPDALSPLRRATILL